MAIIYEPTVVTFCINPPKSNALESSVTVTPFTVPTTLPIKLFAVIDPTFVILLLFALRVPPSVGEVSNATKPLGSIATFTSLLVIGATKVNIISSF